MAFRAQHAIQPSPQDSYNDDDVDIPRYVIAARSYADRQRKGLQEEHLDSMAMEEHRDAALSSPFFLSFPPPLPQSIQDALSYVSSTDPSVILRFWGDQLVRMDQLASDSLPTDRDWNELISSTIRPSEGKIRLAPPLSLMHQRNMGGSIWLRRFLVGFKLTGALSQRFTFPTSGKALRKKLTPLSKIAASTSSRFTERASRSGFKQDQLLWNEAMGKTSKGWISQASTLSSDGDPFTLQDPKLNVAFRFGFNKPTN